MEQLNDIIAKIKDGSCVLIIGPDIIDFGEKTFFESMCSEFLSNPEYKENIDIAPENIFANEELFQTKHPNYVGDLKALIKKFYHEQSSYDIPLSKISQIPFPLIISLMPDRRLVNIFANQNLEYNYAFYPGKNDIAVGQVEEPTTGKPLVYNLLGDLNTQHTIITFDDFFAFLSNILGKKALPTQIDEHLMDSKSFLFLGVNLEKWYAQFLLRKIIPMDNIEKRFIPISPNNRKEVYAFVARRLNLKVLDLPPNRFIDLLYEECRNQKLLKTPKLNYKRSVFVSYRSIDKEVALRVEKRLSQEAIMVIRDDISTHAGQKIEHFIETIKVVDCLFLIVSADSLKSKWVFKEIMMALSSNIRFFRPYCIDKSFVEQQFWDGIDILIKENLDNIGSRIRERGSDAIDDLLVERKDWTDYKNSLPTVKNALMRGICKPIDSDNFENSMEQLIKELLN